MSDPEVLAGAVRSIVRELGRPVSVLVGSAVSRAAPSGLPMVGDVYKAALTSLAIAGPDRVAGRLQQNAFELLMEEIDDLLTDGPGATVTELLEAVYSLGEPNAWHRCLAQMLRDGEIDALLTTNFDVHLSAAVRGLRPADDNGLWGEAAQALRHRPTADGCLRDVVVHLHSSVRNPARLGAFMRRVGEPVSDERCELLEEMHSLGFGFVFVGYGANDADLTPLLSPGCPPRDNPRIGWIRSSDPGAAGPVRTISLFPPDEPVAVARDTVTSWVARLVPADRDRLAGHLLRRSGDLHAARILFRRACRASSSAPATTFAFASTLSDQMLYSQAVAALATAQDLAGAERVRQLGHRGLLKRMLGDEDSAVDDFTKAHATIDGLPRSETRTGNIVMTLCQEVEARIVLASRLRADERAREIERAQACLAQAAAWAERNPSGPRHDLTFYQAEIAMALQRYAEAAALYRRFESEVRRWRPGVEGKVGSARRIAALSFAGRRRPAAREWLTQVIEAARRVRPFVLLHALGAGLVVVVRRPSLYWWMRREAAPAIYRVAGLLVGGVIRVGGRGQSLSLPDGRMRSRE